MDNQNSPNQNDHTENQDQIAPAQASNQSQENQTQHQQYQQNTPQQNPQAPQQQQQNPTQQTQQAAGASSSAHKINFDLDKRSIETLKWGAAGFAIAAIIKYITNIIAFGFFYSWAFQFTGVGTLLRNIEIGEVLGTAISGAIGGAIFGYLLSKFYPYIQDLVTKHLKDKVDTFFKLLFYPYVIGFIADLLLGATFFAVFGIGSIVRIAGYVFAGYVFAKFLNKKVGTMYEAPVRK